MQHNAEFIQQYEHYKAVKARLTAPRPVVVIAAPSEPEPDPPAPEIAEFEAVSPVTQEVVLAVNALSVFEAAETARQIVREECARHGVSVRDVSGPCRFKEVVYCRHWIMYRIYEATSWSFPRIGRYFGKDHTTVLHGIRKIRAEIIAAKASQGPVEQ